MSDLISRQAAIDALIEWYGCEPSDLDYFKEIVEKLPSADNEVVGKLKTAIESEELCKNCPTAERISSENLLGAMALGFSYGTNADRHQGKWIESFKPITVKQGAYMGTKFIHDGWSCSECSEVVEKRYPNCPYCLARMKGVDDEAN